MVFADFCDGEFWWRMCAFFCSEAMIWVLSRFRVRGFRSEEFEVPGTVVSVKFYSGGLGIHISADYYDLICFCV